MTPAATTPPTMNGLKGMAAAATGPAAGPGAGAASGGGAAGSGAGAGVVAPPDVAPPEVAPPDVLAPPLSWAIRIGWPLLDDVVCALSGIVLAVKSAAAAATAIHFLVTRTPDLAHTYEVSDVTYTQHRTRCKRKRRAILGVPPGFECADPVYPENAPPRRPRRGSCGHSWSQHWPELLKASLPMAVNDVIRSPSAS